MKLKKGDHVWVRVPITATIISVNKKFGYTLQANQESTTYRYFDDSEVDKIISYKRPLKRGKK